MKSSRSKQGFYASLMIVGAGILLFRTIRMMLVENAFDILVFWVVALLVLEFFLDLACVLGSLRWLFFRRRTDARFPLIMGAMATILHAIRVFIYVLGRTGPWVNFDVRQEYWEGYQFEWFWVYFAATLSILGLIGVIVIWQLIRFHSRTIKL